MDNLGPTISSHGLEKQGFGGVSTAHWNYGTAALYTAALGRHEARIGRGGALVVETGVHTGRSAQDKFITRESSSADNIWWGAVNKDITEETFDGVLNRMQGYLTGR